MCSRLMGDIVLRRATIADLPTVWEILHASGYGRSEQPPSVADVPPYLVHEPAIGEMWVADQADQLLGSIRINRRSSRIRADTGCTLGDPSARTVAR